MYSICGRPQLVGSTISGYVRPLWAPAGVKTLPLRVIPPEPGMSWKRSSDEDEVAAGPEGAAVAASAAAAWAWWGDRPRAAAASRAATAAAVLVVRGIDAPRVRR